MRAKVKVFSDIRRKLGGNLVSLCAEPTNHFCMRPFVFFLWLLAWGLPASAQLSPEGLKRQLHDYLATKRAHTGVAVIVNGRDTLTVNNDARYPLLSVFKFHQALAVADYLQREQLPLNTSIHLEKADLPTGTYSPLRDKYPDGNIDLPVADLLVYTLQQSDNNACDVLFNRTVGVAETDAYIRSLGLRDFAIAATEADMHRDEQQCYRNWSTPLEAAKLLEIFITRPLLAEPYHSFIRQAMVSCETGQDRLAKPLHGTEAVIGHKTGTGDRNAKGAWIGINDIGFVFLPDGQRYTIAVFVKDAQERASESAEIIATVSRMVYRYLVP